MTAPPSITEASIQAHIDPRSFKRGLSYANAGRVVRTRRLGRTLKAHCIGTAPQPYQLHATISDEGAIVADCSCPVGCGGRCKHVAALLLTWLAAPDDFIEVEDLSTTLERKTKEELIDLLLGIAAVHPQVELQLERATNGDAGVGIAFYRGQVEALLGRSGWGWDDYGGYGFSVGRELPALVDQADAMGERGDWRGAATAYRGVLEGIIGSDAVNYDESGELIMIGSRCILGLGNCLGYLDDPSERGSVVNALFEAYCHDIDEWGGLGLADVVPELLVEMTTPEERAEIREMVRRVLPPEDGWAHWAYANLLFMLESELFDDEAYLAQCRELGLFARLVDRLLELGREDEALDVAADASPEDLYRLLPNFTDYQLDDRVEPVVAQRVSESHGVTMLFGAGAALEDWLKMRYTARGDIAAALALAQRTFKSRPTMALYQEVRELATSAGEWSDIRPGLLSWLAERSPELLIEIHLDEGELDEAIEVSRRPNLSSPYYFYGADIRLRLAEAAATTRPDVAIEIYLERADQLIAARGREKYKTAAVMLGRARDIYDTIGRFEEWEEHINRLRSDNTRLWALREELDRANL